MSAYFKQYFHILIVRESLVFDFVEGKSKLSFYKFVDTFPTLFSLYI